MAPRKFIIHFTLGMVNGFFLLYLLQIFVFHSSFCTDSRFCPPRPAFIRDDVSARGSRHLHDKNDLRNNLSSDISEKKKKAEAGATEIRVLCWILTSPANHDEKAKHVLATWGRRCHKIIFMSSAADEALNAVAIIDGEGRDRLWEKTKAAFQYIYERHLDEADWFLKADDDTYVVMENLHRLLRPHNASVPLFFGRRLYAADAQTDFMSGGAGYVLSRAGVRKLVQEGFPNASRCRQGGAGPEDVQLGECVRNTGIFVGDSRDDEGKERFFPLSSAAHVVPIPENNWLNRLTYYPLAQGLEGMSSTAVSFHYISPSKMYELEYLLYRLQVRESRACPRPSQS